VAAARRRAGHERERTMTRLRQTAAEMAELASTDPLTGLRNQREFYARLDRELYEMQDDERPLALALLDVDDFKQINDKRGHLIGDQVLIEIARRVEHQAVACGGFSARVGGEEFAVVLPPRASEESRSIAESLRSAIEPPIIPVGLVTVSVGLAHARSNDDAIALFRRADRALYAAKRAGKNCVQVAEDALSLFDELNEGKASGSDAYDALSSLVSSVDRSQAMEGHSQRVARFAASLARRVGWGPDQVARIRQAALLHDVGKVTVPSGILAKPGRLTEGESSLVSAHPEVGSEIVRRALDPEQASWVLHHHERWDGVGYPDGLVGEEIPEGARILAIADAWDAMTSDRVYAPALDAEAAVAELNACKGTQFWPRGVELMVALAGEPSREQAPA
jgi:diguanylate cyclase (GGDEF)-like protein/putative nucleotidyltransferase with HDIG domain